MKTLWTQTEYQIGNSLKTLADLEDDDMDIQNLPIKTKMTPIFLPDDKFSHSVELPWA